MIDAKAARELRTLHVNSSKEIKEKEMIWHPIIVERASAGEGFAILEVPVRLRKGFEMRMKELGFSTKQEEAAAVELVMLDYVKYRVMW